MSGYTKLFNSILASTIWREDDKTRIVWITLLAMADKNGVAEGSVPGLADLARVSIEDTERALNALSSPDRYSRSQEHEGRRIAAVDGGWQLLNHGKYRAKMSADERREYNRVKQAEWRSRQKASTNVNYCDSQSALSAHTEAAPKAAPKAKEEKKSARKGAPTDEFVPSLKAMDCYKPLDIDSELQRAEMWCTRNRRECTERFFLNWLNRALDNHRTVKHERGTEADRDRERTGIVNSTVGATLKRL